MRQFWWGTGVGIAVTTAVFLAMLTASATVTVRIPAAAVAEEVAPVLAPLAAEVTPSLVSAIDQSLGARATLAVTVDGSRIVLPPTVVHALIRAVRPSVTRAVVEDLARPDFDRRVLAKALRRAMDERGVPARVITVPVRIWPGVRVNVRVRLKTSAAAKEGHEGVCYTG